MCAVIRPTRVRCYGRHAAYELTAQIKKFRPCARGTTLDALRQTGLFQQYTIVFDTFVTWLVRALSMTADDAAESIFSLFTVHSTSKNDGSPFTTVKSVECAQFKQVVLHNLCIQSGLSMQLLDELVDCYCCQVHSANVAKMPFVDENSSRDRFVSAIMRRLEGAHRQS
jgi:hypothetical protein